MCAWHTYISSQTAYFQLQVITLICGSDMKVEAVSDFTDPGYSALDSFDGDVTGNVVVSGLVRL